MDAQTEISKALNDYGVFASYQPTWAFRQLINLPHNIICLFTGNQAMKTSSVAYQYVMRIHGWHPVAHKNVLYFECPNDHDPSKDKDFIHVVREYYLHRPSGAWLQPPTNEGEKYLAFSIQNRPDDNLCSVCRSQLQIHKRERKVYRFASEILPGEKGTTTEGGSESKEIKNSTYPEFKKWLPPFLIKQDITFRNPSMTVSDPNGGRYFGNLYYDATDIVVEFASYKQTVQATAGVQRMSIWLDEESPYDFYKEQLPRLIKENGDLIKTLTPANRMSWTFDELYEKAQLYIRSQAIVDFMKRDTSAKVEQVERTDSDRPVAVIQAATDDNPTLSINRIEEILEQFDDPDDRATRRYGVHKATTGRIYKDFDFRTHVIDLKTLFPHGFFDVIEKGEYILARLIDYHQHIPWACLWVALSPMNEMFVWDEYNPNPEKLITSEIALEIAWRSEYLVYDLDLIDSLANMIQSNTGTTVIQDLNEAFFEMNSEGICEVANWEPWSTRDTQQQIRFNTRGRNELRTRLKNSLRVGKPFSNKVVERGKVVVLPTIWIHKVCKETAKSLRNWRLEEWATNQAITTKDRKETAQKKWSHHCTALESFLRDSRAVPNSPRHRGHGKRMQQWARRSGRTRR